MARRVHITVDLGLRTHYGRQVLLGVSRYVPRHCQWDIFVLTGFLGPDRFPSQWRRSGVISAILSNDRIGALLKAGVPVINVSAKYEIPQIQTIVSDDHMVGTIAAEHLLDLGLKSLAYCGHSGFGFSHLRGDGFAEAARKAGAECSRCERPYGRGGKEWAKWSDRMGRWIWSLKKPVGIMAFTDAHAWRIQRVCRDIGMAIPEEVALVGVNNDSLIVNMCQPALSSVELNAVRIGYEAAEMLDGLIHRRHTPDFRKLVDPVGIVARGSSDIEAIEDTQIARALRFIKEHAVEGIEVEDVLDQVTISRRTLERRFRERLCRSPHDEIMRVRFERAERLLVETTATVATVAEGAGFGSLKNFHRVFKKRTGVTPAEFRNRRCLGAVTH